MVVVPVLTHSSKQVLVEHGGRVEVVVPDVDEEDEEDDVEDVVVVVVPVVVVLSAQPPVGAAQLPSASAVQTHEPVQGGSVDVVVELSATVPTASTGRSFCQLPSLCW